MTTTSWYDDTTFWETTPANWTSLNATNTSATLPPLIEGIFVHPFWETFREEYDNFPVWAYYLLGMYFAVVCICGAIGNLLVIYIFVTTKSLRTPPNMFVINLAVSDLGFSLVNGFPLTTISCFMKKWYYGDLACQLYAFFGGVFGFNSINTLAWISVDRYNVIAKPLQSMYLVTHKRAVIKLIFIWLWSVGWAVPPLFGWGAYVPEGLLVSCSFDYMTRTPMNMAYCYSMFFCGFVMPVLTIFYCYINIVRAVSAQAGEMRKTAERMGAKASKSDRDRRQEIQLAKVSAITIGLFLISWIPYAAVAESAVSGLTGWINPMSTTIPILFAKASATWNPMIYALSHPRFRAALEQKIPWLVLCKESNKPERAGSEMDTNASTIERNTPATAGGNKHQREPEEDTSSICTDISESSTEDYQNARVSTVPNPSAKASPKPAHQQAPPRPNPPKPQQSAKPQHESKVQETSLNNGPSNSASESVSPKKPTVMKRAGSNRMRASLSKSAESAFRNLVTAYTNLKRVHERYGGKGEANDLKEAGGPDDYAFENPAYKDKEFPDGMTNDLPALPDGQGQVYSVPVEENNHIPFNQIQSQVIQGQGLQQLNPSNEPVTTSAPSIPSNTSVTTQSSMPAPAAPISGKSAAVSTKETPVAMDSPSNPETPSSTSSKANGKADDLPPPPPPAAPDQNTTPNAEDGPQNETQSATAAKTGEAQYKPGYV